MNSTGKKSYKTAIEILQLYINTGLPKRLKNEVKTWLVSDFHAEEKQAALWELWENLESKEKGNKGKAWKAIKARTGIKGSHFLNSSYKQIKWNLTGFFPMFLQVKTLFKGLFQDKR